MTLLVFTPLPPMPTGIADYSFELLPLLALDFDCIVVVEDLVLEWRVPPGVAVISLAEYEDRDFSGALHLYHVGNNPDHVYMLPVLARHPGVVVLHDPGLHHLLDCATAALGDVEAYGAAVEAEYGAPGRVLVEQWRDHELRDQSMLYGMPMLRQLLGPARHVIVHSRAAARKVRCEAPDTPVSVVPHQYAAPAVRGNGAALRAELGIGPNEIVFLSLGFVSHIKRVDTALRALARVAERLPPFRYVIAGALRTDELDVEGLSRRLGIWDRVLTTGYVAEATFFAFIDMADVVINLRWPVGGETSGTLIRAMGSGACVVVVDAGPFAELPEGTAVRLPWGPRFEIELADTLLRLAAFPDARAAIGATAAREIGRLHHPEVTRAAYRAAITAAMEVADRPWRRDAGFAYAPVQAVAAGDGPLWLQVNAAPLGSEGTRVLMRGKAADRTALRALGHVPEVAGKAWRPEAEEARSRDLLFLHCGAGDALLREADLAARLNRVLRFGGVLVLCVSGMPGHVLARRGGGEAVWRAAGFRVELGEAAAAPDMGPPVAPVADEMVWRVVKVSEFIARLDAQVA